MYVKQFLYEISCSCCIKSSSLRNSSLPTKFSEEELVAEKWKGTISQFAAGCCWYTSPGGAAGSKAATGRVEPDDRGGGKGKEKQPSGSYIPVLSRRGEAQLWG